jgi:hypothetical protein
VLGIPDQYILLVAYIDSLLEAKATGTSVDPQIIAQIEDDMPKIVILPCQSTDPSLAICRMVVQECWRQAMLIYFYMVSLYSICIDDSFPTFCRYFMEHTHSILGLNKLKRDL